MRLGVVQFADLARLVRSRSVEVAQAGEAQPVGPVVRFQRSLKHEFRHPVRIDRVPRGIFGDGDLHRNSVDGTGRGEDDLLHAAVDAGVQKRQTRFHVVAKVFSRIFDRLSYIGVGCEVHDGIDVPQSGRERLAVRHVGLDELEAIRQASIAGRQIVVDERFVAVAPQNPGRVASNVACTANYKDFQSACLQETVM